MHGGPRAAILAVSLALAASCYRPQGGECRLQCDQASACPANLTCMADGYCHGAGEAATCGVDAAGLDAPAIDAPGDASPPDAAVDAPLPDAAVDAPPLDAAVDAGVVTASVIAAGDRHACAIAAGVLYCWGDNRASQLGIAATTLRRAPTPHRIGSGANWTTVAGGQAHTCAIAATGEVACWGDGTFGQNGASTSGAIPQLVAGGAGALAGATAVCAGARHSCAVVDGGARIACWGSDAAGQLGDGPGDSSGQLAVTVLEPAPLQWRAVACGDAHSCGLTDAGDVYCWGANTARQLGQDQPDTSAPTVAAVTGAAQVVAGQAYACARTTAGGVTCWGSYGAVVAGTPSDIAAGVGLGMVTLISGGRTGVCATDGVFTKCLGAVGDGHGATGDGTFADVTSFGPNVSGLTGAGVTALASGASFHCALAAGQVRCWGDNSDGQLGQGVVATGATPRQVPGTWTAVSAGEHATCAVATSGAVSCWGQNFRRGVVPASTAPLFDQPTQVAGVAGASAVAVGVDHACAVTATGTTCWGDGDFGRTGTGVATGTIAPTVAWAGAGVVAVGDRATVAAESNGNPRGLFAWGDNTGNRIGLAAAGPVLTPTALDTSNGWGAAGLGADFGCARKLGAVSCWGQGERGQLAGPGSAATPIAIAGSYSELAVGAFGRHACAVSAGRLLCWGANDAHQAGPAAGDVATPTAIDARTDWSLVAAGRATSCGVRGTTGELACWGANDARQAGVDVDATGADLTTPTVVGAGYTAVSLGWSHGCAIKAAGNQLWCWGESRYGAAGLPGARDYPTPQPVTLGP